MKKYMKYLLLILILLMPTGAWGTTWFAGAGDTDFNAVSGGTTSSVWNDNADGTSGTYLDFSTKPVNGDIFVANGATIAIDADIGTVGTVVTLTTEGTDYGGTDGGGFTVAINSVGALTLYTNTIAGTTDCLVVSGAGAGATTTELTIIGNITGSAGTAAADGLYSSHTLGVIVVTGNATGVAGAAIRFAGATGSVTVSGTALGAANTGLIISSGGTASVAGACQGGASAFDGHGCAATGTGAITVSGNIINGTRSSGTAGTIKWTPATAKNYIKIDGGGTVIYASAYLASAADGTKVTPANTAAQISTGTYFIKSDDYDGSTLTQGTKAAGGGASAW